MCAASSSTAVSSSASTATTTTCSSWDRKAHLRGTAILRESMVAKINSATAAYFQELCVYVLPEGITPFLRFSAPLYNIFTRVFFFARVPPANCQNFAASRTNTGTCAAAATLTFTATTSSRSSSSSLVSREAIKSSTKETNTLFFFPAPAYFFSCSSSSKTRVTSLYHFSPFAHNFDTVLTEEKNLFSAAPHQFFDSTDRHFCSFDSLTTFFCSPLLFLRLHRAQWSSDVSLFRD